MVRRFRSVRSHASVRQCTTVWRNLLPSNLRIVQWCEHTHTHTKVFQSWASLTLKRFSLSATSSRSLQKTPCFMIVHVQKKSFDNRKIKGKVRPMPKMARSKTMSVQARFRSNIRNRPTTKLRAEVIYRRKHTLRDTSRVYHPLRSQSKNDRGWKRNKFPEHLFLLTPSIQKNDRGC
jgi:hypothetical protein